MILLSLQGIQKSFGTNEVLRDASLVLQDGQRISEGLGNGWRTENRKASYVDIDLGRTLKFNRIDLYPAGSIFDYGSSFPETLTISVSTDGKTYKEVKTLSDIEIKTTKGMKVDIGE